MLRFRTWGNTRFIESCLPSTAKHPSAGPDWIHEIKHDGFIFARRDAAGARLGQMSQYQSTALAAAAVGSTSLRTRVCLLRQRSLTPLRHLARRIAPTQYKISMIKFQISKMAITPATASARAFVASW